MEQAAIKVYTKETVQQLSGKKLLEMLQLAAGKLKYPKIKVKFGHNRWVVFYLAGSGANKGGINIVDDKPYPDSKYFGKITSSGAVVISAAGGYDSYAMDIIGATLESPAEFLKVQGQRMGICCFCARELTKKHSIAAGYGPTCADNYGLPWGFIDDEDNQPKLEEI